MSEFATLIQQGSANSWLFIPSAILLGALHGLEPGHSKTMMAAFIVAIRGTVGQAVMLGLAATVSHTLIVWIIALAGMHYGTQWNTETTEPWLQLASGILIIGVAMWVMLTTRRHLHTHHELHGSRKMIDTGHGILLVEIAGNRFRVMPEGENELPPGNITIATERADGRHQMFDLVLHNGRLESTEEVPEPHEFIVRLHLVHDEHGHDYDVEFARTGHFHVIGELDEFELAVGEQDPHELAHANDIRRRFAHRKVTNGQILLFGLTGGLIPCPASITVLLICLQLKQFTLGAILVLCFSIGLALTMVLSGVIAALSVERMASKWDGFGDLARKAPYLSSGLITLVGMYVGWQGMSGLVH